MFLINLLLKKLSNQKKEKKINSRCEKKLFSGGAIVYIRMSHIHIHTIVSVRSTKLQASETHGGKNMVAFISYIKSILYVNL